MRCVRDVMLPLDDVPVVREDATLAEAVGILEAADQSRPPGRPHYRAVLVTNARGQVVGKLGHLAFLKALEPGHEAPAERAALDRAGVDPELLGSIAGHRRLLEPSLEACCRRAAHTRVCDAMHAMPEALDEDTPINEAVTAIVRLQTLSILVRRGDAVVGLLRLADLYQVVAALITTR